MKTKLIGPYGSRDSRDRHLRTLRNRNPGAKILARAHGPGFYIEHYHCYQVINNQRGIMTLEEWVQWHRSQRNDQLKGLTTLQMIARYWGVYVKNHGGVQSNDGCAARQTTSWPPKGFGTLPTLGWRASPNYGSRNGAKIDGIILHESEGSYTSLVNWLCNPASRVSAHLCVREDGGAIIQTVGYSKAAWHAKGVNSHTIGIEFAGYVKTANDPRQLANGARLVAMLCDRFGIPAKRGDDSGHGGICTHRQLIGNDHTDPDYNGPLAGDGVAAFIEQVRSELSIGRFPAGYGRA